MIGSWSCNHRGSLFHSYTEVATQKLAPRWWASWSSDDIIHSATVILVDGKSQLACSYGDFSGEAKPTSGRVSHCFYVCISWMRTLLKRV